MRLVTERYVYQPVSSLTEAVVPDK